MDTGQILSLVLFLLNDVTANIETNKKQTLLSVPTFPFIAVVSIISLAITSLIGIFLCTDCYKAEVDSTDHPACQPQKTSHPIPDGTSMTAYNYGVSQPVFSSSQFPLAPQTPTNHTEPSAPYLEPVAPLYHQPQRYGAMRGYDSHLY
ncbi:uncharacterized protein LOC115210960 [Argonauta hians]